MAEQGSEGWPTEDSPFQVLGPLAPGALVGRETEVASLLASARSGQAIALTAPRRYGKTSLLLAVADALRREGRPAVVVDLFGAQSLADLVVRLERAYGRYLQGSLRERVEQLLTASGLGISLSGFGFGLRLERHPGTDALPALHELLDLPARVGTAERRVWVALDEFQSVLALEGADGLLRSHLQHQSGGAAYVFAGSEPSLLDQLFSDPARAFFGQAERRRLGRLSDEVVAQIVHDGFQRTERHPGDMIPAVLATAEGHPQRSMLLAHHLWQRTPLGQVSDAARWTRALRDADERVAPEAETRFGARTVNQRRVLRAIAEGRAPHAAEVLAVVGLAKGSVSGVIQSLERLGDLEREGRRWRFTDPLWARWIAGRFAPR